MRVLVLGIDSPLGREIARQALEASHHVTTLVPRPAEITLQHPNLRVLTGDLLAIAAIDPAMAAQHAVICPLAPSPATGIVVRAMRRHNARRLICLSHARTASRYQQLLQPSALRSLQQDTARQEEIVRKCDRNWLLVRHPRLTPGPARGRYSVLPRSAHLPAASLSVADAAEFTVSQLENDAYLYKMLFLADVTV